MQSSTRKSVTRYYIEYLLETGVPQSRTQLKEILSRFDNTVITPPLASAASVSTPPVANAARARNERVRERPHLAWEERLSDSLPMEVSPVRPPRMALRTALMPLRLPSDQPPDALDRLLSRPPTSEVYNPDRVIDGPDEYRDDGDAGYRVRSLPQDCLAEEIAQRANNDPRAAMIGYKPVYDVEAFRRCRSLTASKTKAATSQVKGVPAVTDPSTRTSSGHRMSVRGISVPSPTSQSPALTKGTSPSVAAVDQDELLTATAPSASSDSYRWISVDPPRPAHGTPLVAKTTGGGPRRASSPTFGLVQPEMNKQGEPGSSSPIFGGETACTLIPALDSTHQERYDAVYCEGNKEKHRHRKRRERLAVQSRLTFPHEADGFYPYRDECGQVYGCFNLKVVYEQGRSGFQVVKDFRPDCDYLIAGRYKYLSEIDQAAFSRAYHCIDTLTNTPVCIKLIKNQKDFVDQSIDEIKILRYIQANATDIDACRCLRMIDYFYFKEHLFIVTELLRDNLYAFSTKMRGRDYFTLGRIQKIAYQILVALEYIHSLGLIHGDLKPENVLFVDEASSLVKVIDFGSACYVDDVLVSYVQTRSYRAPEVLLGLCYDQKIDMWSLGCILAELWTGYVLFQADSRQSMLARIVGILGLIPYYMAARSSRERDIFTDDGQLYRVVDDPRNGSFLQILFPKTTSLRQRMRTTHAEFLDFLTALLQIDPSLRLSAGDALNHPFLTPNRFEDGLHCIDGF